MHQTSAAAYDRFAGWSRNGARLVLAGAGPMRERLRAHPYGHRVIMLPYQHTREGLADLLAALDVAMKGARRKP